MQIEGRSTKYRSFKDEERHNCHWWKEINKIPNNSTNMQVQSQIEEKKDATGKIMKYEQSLYLGNSILPMSRS